MTGHDVHRDDMESDPTIAAFARDLQDAASATPAPAVGASLAAVLDGRVPTGVYPEVVLPGRVRATRRSLRLRWALATAAFGVGAGSLGVAGALPGPVQRQVSRMAEVVGLNLPDGSADPAPVEPIAPPSTAVVPPRPTVPANDRPVPSTVPDDPSNRGNREGRGQGDERGAGRSQTTPADAEDVRADLDDDRGGQGRGNDIDADGMTKSRTGSP